MTRRALGAAFGAILAMLVLPLAASGATALVRVENPRIDRDRAVITATVVWNQAAAVDEDAQAGVGDVRAVAVSADGHVPTFLGAAPTYASIEAQPRQEVTIPYSGEAALAAIRPGNRVVVTATQHSETPDWPFAIVAVGTAQRFTTPQDRVGRLDCSDRALVPGAIMNRCDLVGADLDGVEVSHRRPVTEATRLLLADLTGATLRAARLTGASIAGGRLNGADLTDATIDNFSLAAAQARGLVAVRAKSVKPDDVRTQWAGANFFATELGGASFADATLNNVSLSRARADGASFAGSRWGYDGDAGLGMNAEAASMVGADLTGVQAFGPLMAFANLTDAKLNRTNFLPVNLADAILCRTQTDIGPQDRDCPVKSDPGTKPAQNPFVEVRGRIVDAGLKTITGVVRWNDAGRRSDMTAGRVRAVAVDARTGRSTLLFETKEIEPLPARTEVLHLIVDADKRRAMRAGNRIVLTATQHQTGTRVQPSRRAWVTVDTLQAGPGRGRVGSVDCSDRGIVPGVSLESCDLAGADFDTTLFNDQIMTRADLSGATLDGSTVRQVILDGAAMGSVSANNATLTDVRMLEANAPELSARQSTIYGYLHAKSLEEADFTGATISSTTFAGTPMRRARFTNATFTGQPDSGVDLAYTDLRGARLDVRTVDRPSSLFMADLTDATLKGPDWPVDTAGDIPWRWAVLCRTTLPPGGRVDDDCPKVPAGAN